MNEAGKTFTDRGLGEYIALQETVRYLLEALASSSKEGRRIVRQVELDVESAVKIAKRDYVRCRISAGVLEGLSVGMRRLLGSEAPIILDLEGQQNQETNDVSVGSGWFVGAYWDSEDPPDQTPRFIRDGIWECGYEDDYHQALVRSIRANDSIAIKTTYRRTHGLPFQNHGRDVAVMGIRAIGVVQENPNNGQYVKVNWTETFTPAREWYFFVYLRTIWQVKPETWMRRNLLDFAFTGGDQDIRRFLKDPYWGRRYQP